MVNKSIKFKKNTFLISAFLQQASTAVWSLDLSVASLAIHLVSVVPNQMLVVPKDQLEDLPLSALHSFAPSPVPKFPQKNGVGSFFGGNSRLNPKEEKKRKLEENQSLEK